ncbi:hypothetical protein [Tunturiibacter gelidoferens]|uniref:Uncharacterized protein n=1 Tax=Tunturiibacter gelidiferens TaxID=3069689 RepID=A0A9X0QHF1_9BACT|nr:hypothetical protein [Edaphobacter lichenicola]MBB5330497.1 hypothetical protein [Edaphobacter lichenicola]
MLSPSAANGSALVDDFISTQCHDVYSVLLGRWGCSLSTLLQRGCDVLAEIN